MKDKYSAACGKYGRLFLESEIGNNFEFLNLIKNEKVQDALDWIACLSAESRNEFIDALFLNNLQNTQLIEFRKLISGAGERYQFAGSQSLIRKVMKDYDSIEFVKIDKNSIGAKWSSGNVRLFTVVNASSRLYNIEIATFLYDNDSSVIGSFSLCGCAKIFHGDCWKASDLDPHLEYKNVIRVLGKQREMIVHILDIAGINPQASQD